MPEHTIAENLARLQAAKTAIGNAIVAKGGTVNSGDGLEEYPADIASIENSYTASDEGKVVNNGALVSQTTMPTAITTNDTYNTTMYNSVTVDVANTYTQSDEGKVVSNGALVAQTAKPDVIAENGVYDTTLYDSVNVNVPSESQKRKDVNFYDYDGTIVKSYTAAEFANISELPDNPSHAGLTSQGWNWSLADAKAYVAKYGKLEIGQMYITDDGKTRIYITLTEGRTSPYLQLYLNANSELDVDWGDGSRSTFLAISANYVMERHNYATAGDYVIAITVITGNFVLQSSSTNISSILWNGNDDVFSPDSAYANSIQKIEIGTGMTSIGGKAFFLCCSLSSVTIPDSVTNIGNTAFSGCYSLSSITLPDSVTNIGNTAFVACYSLSSITLPDSVTGIGNTAFYSCSSLSSITLPDSVTGISINCFQYCYALSSVTIPNSVTGIGNLAFQLCRALSYITLPDSVTGIGNEAFEYCYALSSVTIPNSVTSIGGEAFYECYSLSSVTIGNSVTTIAGSAFQDCSYMESIKFTSITPPAVVSSNVWNGIPTTCKIYVPYGRLNTYKTATNYPNPSIYTYVEY